MTSPDASSPSNATCARDGILELVDEQMRKTLADGLGDVDAARKQAAELENELALVERPPLAPSDVSWRS